MGADLPEKTTAVLATAQRPIDGSAFTEKVTAAAAKTLPSTFVIGREDRAIDPDSCASWPAAHTAVRSRSMRRTLGLISHAGAVANAIRGAAQ